MEGVKFELWARDPGGEFSPAVTLFDCDVESVADVIDVTGFDDPTKPNPKRTRWAVFLARITFRKPPPRRVFDADKPVVFRESALGLRSTTFRARLDPENFDGAERILRALHERDFVQIAIDGQPAAMLLVTDFSVYPDGPRVVGYVQPLQESPDHENP